MRGRVDSQGEVFIPSTCGPGAGVCCHYAALPSLGGLSQTRFYESLMLDFGVPQTIEQSSQSSHRSSIELADIGRSRSQGYRSEKLQALAPGPDLDAVVTLALVAGLKQMQGSGVERR